MTSKRMIVEAAVQNLESMIRDFQQRIKDAMSNEGNVNEEEYDNHQIAFEAQTLSEVNLLNEHVRFATKELEELRQIESFEDQALSSVGFGCVVRTDKRTFFVSTSLEEFFVNGEEILCLSVRSPIYQSMRGKRKGETFSHAGVTYHILEIV